jgi:TatD DNase family protein
MPFARGILDLGMMISFSGIITFKNAERLREVAAEVPDDRLLIETDAPLLAPVPHRGERNEPAFLAHTARCLAEIRHCTMEHVADITTRNADHLFGFASAPGASTERSGS